MNLKLFFVSLLTMLLISNIEVIAGVNGEQSITESPRQVRKVSGTIKDEKGEPLIGVSIRLKDVLIGTRTDENGVFILEIPFEHLNPTLVITYLGMIKQEITIGKRTTMDVVMKEVEDTLQEVVITGVFSKAKESFTGAASMMRKDDIQMAGTRSLLTSVQNLDPSFNIAQDLAMGSDPNGIPNITMRGSSSLPTDVKDMQVNQDAYRMANQPLFILNGFEITLERFKDLDENLVESITLLKDANSTALYGTKGSNGVVVISTKKPQKGKLSITYRGQLSLEAPDLGSYNLMNATEKLSYEKAAGLYNADGSPSNQVTLDALYNQRRLDIERGVDTYWIKFPVRTGVGQRHSVTIEGGDEAMTYSGGLSYNGVEGSMKGSSRRTISGDITLDYKRGNVSVRNDLRIASMDAKNSPYGSFDTYTKINSYYSPYAEDGTYAPILDNSIKYLGLGTSSNTIYNPLYDASLPNVDKNEYIEISDNFMLNWKITKELSFNGVASITTSRKRSDKYTPIGHSRFADYPESENSRKGTYNYGTGNSFRYGLRTTMSYNKVFDKKHHLSANTGATLEEDKSENYSIMAEGISTPTMDFLGMASQYQKGGRPLGTESIIRSAGLLMSLNYIYDHRYFFDMSGKYEGSSQFGANKKFAPIWSLGAGWNIHAEEFMNNQKIVDVARIRLSYGVTGSQAFSPYQAIVTYQDYASSGYLGWYGMQLMQFGNPDLDWQKTKQVNLGVDLEVLDRRVKLAVDVYNKVTDNLLADISLPSASGFTRYKSNVGEVENRGIEVDLSGLVIRSQDSRGFMWNVGVKLMHNKNTIKEISNSLDELNSELGSQESRNPSFMFKEGESMNTIFAVRSKGIDPSSGKEIFIKLDGTETDVWDAKDQVACGIAEPKVLGNINTTIRYKGFNASAFFSFRFGGQLYNSTLANKVENILPYQNADKRAYYDRWKEVGDESKFKSVLDKSTTYASTRFVMDDNTFSCASFSFGYDLPSIWSNKYLFSRSVSVKLYLEDLFQISSIKQERGTSYPYARKYSLAVSATF